jgi:hypothetical protein
MPIDLTFHNKKYNERLQDAIEIAEELIDDLEENWCCYKCHITKNIPVTNGSRGAVVMSADVIQSVMFSSGYWFSYTVRKKGDDFILGVKVSKMTEQEAIDNHMPDDDEDEQDPLAMD